MKKVYTLPAFIGILALLITTTQWVTLARADAISLNDNAVPSLIVYSNHSNDLNFDELPAPTGDWTTTIYAAVEGETISYTMPIASTCDTALVTHLSVHIDESDVVLTPPVDQDLIGAAARVVSKTSGITLPVSSVISGTRYDGAFLIGSGYQGQIIGRGVTNPAFSTVPVTMPGSIEFEIDTTGMTVAQYNDLAITVVHDMLTVLGTADLMRTSQPTVNLVTDDSSCLAATTTTSPPGVLAGDASQSALAETGNETTLLLFSAGSLIALGYFSNFITRYRREYTQRCR